MSFVIIIGLVSLIFKNLTKVFPENNYTFKRLLEKIMFNKWSPEKP